MKKCACVGDYCEYWQYARWKTEKKMFCLHLCLFSYMLHGPPPVYISFCRTLDGKQTRQNAVTYKEQHKHRSLAVDSNPWVYFFNDKRQQTPQTEWPHGRGEPKQGLTYARTKSPLNLQLQMEISANSSCNKLPFQPTVVNYKVQTVMHIMKCWGFETKNSYLQCLA